MGRASRSQSIGWSPLWTSIRCLSSAKPCCEEDRHPFSSGLQPSGEGSERARNEIQNEGWQAGQKQSAFEVADYDRLQEMGTPGETVLVFLGFSVVLTNCWLPGVWGHQCPFTLVQVRYCRLKSFLPIFQMRMTFCFKVMSCDWAWSRFQAACWGQAVPLPWIVCLKCLTLTHPKGPLPSCHHFAWLLWALRIVIFCLA